MTPENTEYLPHWEIEKRERQEWLDRLFTKLGDQPTQPQDFLIERLLPRGYLAILAGDPKSGKSCLATALALSIATGTPFASMTTNQAPVLWLSLEESPAERAEVFRTPSTSSDGEGAVGGEALGDHASEDTDNRQSTIDNSQSEIQTPNSKLQTADTSDSPIHPLTHSPIHDVPIYTTHERIAIDTDEGLDALWTWVMRTDAGLIVVDPLHAAHSGRL